MNIRYRVFFVCMIAVLTLIVPIYAQNYWQSSAIPGVTRAINVLGVNANGDVFAGTNGGGLHRSTDGGATWTRLDASPMKAYFYSVGFNGTTVFAGSYLGVAYRSTDNGTTWTEIAVGTAKSIVTSFVVTSDGGLVAGTGTDGAFKSGDNGATWIKLSGFVGSGPQSTPNIFPIAFDNLGFLYAGTYGNGVYRSDATGGSWLFDGLNGMRINAFALNPSGGLFAGTDAGVYKDTLVATQNKIDTNVYDTTHVWKNVLDTLVTSGDTLIYRTFVSTIVGTPAGILIAGTAGRGTFRSANFGEHWDRVNTGLATLDIRSMAINAQGFIYCGTLNGVVYKSSSPESMVPITPPRVVIPPVLPKKYVVEQNYPNPFNPTTIIPFAIPVAGHASMKIYNAMGQEVADLLNQEMPAGNHSVKWDASNVPSGMYFYRFQSASFSQTGKLMLMK